MRVTFLLRDGLSQVVLTPATKADRAVLELLHDGSKVVEVHRAQFSETRGGFVRQFRLDGHSLAGSDNLPDTVLVLRPAGDLPDDLVSLPAEADLCKLRDGTWVYRNHAETWQHCPSPVTQTSVETRVETFVPPDDVNAYFRRTADDTWQVYDRQSRVWHPTTGLPEVAGWTYEAEQLKAELRAVRDLARASNPQGGQGVSVSAVCENMTKVVAICDNALGDGE